MSFKHRIRLYGVVKNALSNPSFRLMESENLKFIFIYKQSVKITWNITAKMRSYKLRKHLRCRQKIQWNTGSSSFYMSNRPPDARFTSLYYQRRKKNASKPHKGVRSVPQGSQSMKHMSSHWHESKASLLPSKCPENRLKVAFTSTYQFMRTRKHIYASSRTSAHTCTHICAHTGHTGTRADTYTFIRIQGGPLAIEQSFFLSWDSFVHTDRLPWCIVKYLSLPQSHLTLETVTVMDVNHRVI